DAAPREGAPRRPASFNPAMMPREGGRPKEIDIPVPRRATAETETVKPRPARMGAPAAVNVDDDEQRGPGKRGPGGKMVRPAGGKTADERRERVKLTIQNAF